jgi:hypothetical protein
MLISIGRSVRDCHWVHRSRGSGGYARDIQVQCLLLLLHVRDWSSRFGKEEYISSLSLRLMLWQPSDSALPGMVSSEEPLEAMLSRLSRHARSDLTVDTVKEYSDIFVSMGATNPRAKDVCKPGLSIVFPEKIKIRLANILEAIDEDSVPFIEYSKDKKKAIHGTNEWPRAFRYPSSLYAPMDKNDLTLLLRKAIRNLVTPRKATKEATLAVIRQEEATVRDLVTKKYDPLTTNQTQTKQKVIDSVYAEADRLIKEKADSRKPAPAVKRPRVSAYNPSVQLQQRHDAEVEVHRRRKIPAAKPHVDVDDYTTGSESDANNDAVVISDSESDFEFDADVDTDGERSGSEGSDEVDEEECVVKTDDSDYVLSSQWQRQSQANMNTDSLLLVEDQVLSP